MYQPETQLYIEIISQAMRDALGLSADPSYNPYTKAQALAWFNENDKHFRFVCTIIGLEPSYVIRSLSKFNKQKKNFVRNFTKDRTNLIE